MIIYSVRDGLGRELYWSTDRRAALEMCDLPHLTKETRHGPLMVYKATPIKPKMTTSLLLIALRHPLLVWQGFREGHDAYGMTFDNDPTSRRSMAYDVGRTLREHI